MKRKEKVGIVTLHGYFNYGNRLQNLALKFLLEQIDFEVDTTVISSKDYNDVSLQSKIKNVIKLPRTEILKTVNNKLNPFRRHQLKSEIPLKEKRTLIFKGFSEKYLSENFYSLDNTIELEKIKDYRFFVVGSDQVWHPREKKQLSKYFLTFAEKQKRVAYAPSISSDKLPEEYLSSYKKWFEGMNSISVRESMGAKIIHDLTGKNIPVLADPTLILPQEKWLEVARRAKNRPETPYLLTYFLGGPSNETRKKLEKLANEKNMTIINLGDITERETYETGPSEFLDYINNASAFFTDSFHGVVFSIIFQTPFIVFERQSSGPSMYSRIETILDNFNMRDRESKGFKGDFFSMDFSGTHEVINREYNKSINYLKEALRIEE